MASQTFIRTLRGAMLALMSLGALSATANEPLGRDPSRFMAAVQSMTLIALPEWPNNSTHPLRAIARQLDMSNRVENDLTDEGWSVGLSQTGVAVVRRF